MEYGSDVVDFSEGGPVATMNILFHCRRHAAMGWDIVSLMSSTSVFKIAQSFASYWKPQKHSVALQ
eukprot:7504558-Pyramimonas_sp.AAC.1